MIKLTSHIPKHIRPIIEGIVGPLEKLCEDEPLNDQKSLCHHKVYDQIKHTDFFRLYEILYRSVAVELGFNSPTWVVQKVPTFRFQFWNGGKGTKEFHRDMDYHHTMYSINCIVPLTHMINSSSVYVERVPFTKNFRKMEGNLGDVLVFHGAMLEHGSFQNNTGKTRVSFDFRFAMRDYLMGGFSINRGVPLTVGEYYREI